MDSTVIVAAMGFAATLLGTWLTSRSQQRRDREGRILDARVRIYGDCADALYEYARATYNRVKARLESPDDNREGLRQEAYRANARARSVIGQAAIMTGSESLGERLAAARNAIGEMNGATNHADLVRRQDGAFKTLNDALGNARSDLMTRPTGLR
jgi:hypothetical protein